MYNKYIFTVNSFLVDVKSCYVLVEWKVYLVVEIRVTLGRVKKSRNWYLCIAKCCTLLQIFGNKFELNIGIFNKLHKPF